MLEETTPDKPAFRPEKTYDVAKLKYVRFSDQSFGYVRLDAGLARDQSGNISVYQWSQNKWGTETSLAYDSSWFAAQPGASFEAHSIQPPFDVHGGRLAFTAVYAYSFDMPVPDYWGVEPTVIVFNKSAAGWAEEANLFEADPNPISSTIRFVSIDDNLVLIGVHQDPDLRQRGDSIDVYLFERNGVLWKRILKHATGNPGYRNTAIGKITGDQILLWNDRAELSVLKRIDGDWQLAYSLAVPEANTVASSAFFLFFSIDGSGLSHEILIMEREGDTWSEKTIIKKDTLVFGSSLATDGNFLAVTARPNNSFDCSIVYLYERVRDEWIEVDALHAKDYQTAGSSCALFGEMLSISEGSLFVSGDGPMHTFTWRNQN